MTSDRVHYSTGYRWQLREDAIFDTGIKGVTAVTDYVVLDTHGKLFLRGGYATDGVTGITGTPWACLLEKQWLKRGSFGHDGLYQLIRAGLLDREHRRTADALLKKWCLKDGAWEWQAETVHRVVKKMAGDAIMPSSERPILVAP